MIYRISCKFQFTHSIQSATITLDVEDKEDLLISIHALHTECDDSLHNASLRFDRISIHALHTECD